MQIKKLNILDNKCEQKTEGNQARVDVQFAIKIKQSDEFKTLCKKLDLLKEGLLGERNKKKQLEAQLKKNQDLVSKFEEENKRKQKKYESLTAEIKKLKDQLIQQRNIKSKIEEELICKMQQLGKTSQEKKASLGMFGFNSLFSKDSRMGII